MADFDLTQTDVQVQSILNDAQNAQGAGAQTTLTTDYIMLKDTSGSYHKILKDSFTEACRNVLAGLLVNNNKGTSVSQIPVVASGDFGSVTPANLASVLGVGNIAVPTGATSFDSFTTPGYTVFGTAVLADITNKHSDMLFGVICVRVFTSNLIQQIYYNIRGNKDIFVRYRDSDNVWQTTWRKIATTT